MTDLYMYMYWLMPTLFFVFLLTLGKERIGGEAATTEYSTANWVAMLFGTGMATGLIYWSLPETAYHMLDNPLGVKSVAEASAITWYHWTYNAWMLYTVFAVIVYKFIQSAPKLAQTIAFWVLAISALCGVLVDTGLAILQLPDGYEYMNVALLIGAAVASYFAGVKNGILRVSQAAVIVSFAFLLALGLNSDSSLVLGFLSTGYEYTHLIGSGDFFTLYQDSEWTAAWTRFYSAWWYLWVAFVGVFIVRISRGRTLREMMIVATIVPGTLTAFWMSSFSTLGAEFLTATAIGDNPDNAIYMLMEAMFVSSAVASIMKSIAIFLMYAFMLTSIDSGFYASEQMIGARKLWQRLVMVAVFAVCVTGIAYVGDVAAVQTFALETAQATVLVVLGMTLFVLVNMIHSTWSSINGSK